MSIPLSIFYHQICPYLHPWTTLFVCRYLHNKFRKRRKILHKKITEFNIPYCVLTKTFVDCIGYNILNCQKYIIYEVRLKFSEYLAEEWLLLQELLSDHSYEIFMLTLRNVLLQDTLRDTLMSVGKTVLLNEIDNCVYETQTLRTLCQWELYRLANLRFRVKKKSKHQELNKVRDSGLKPLLPSDLKFLESCVRIFKPQKSSLTHRNWISRQRIYMMVCFDSV